MTTEFGTILLWFKTELLNNTSSHISEKVRVFHQVNMRLISILIQSSVQNQSGDYWNDTNDDTEYGYKSPNYNYGYDSNYYALGAYSYTQSNVWHGDISTTVEVSSQYSDYIPDNMFDDSNETVWTSKFGGEQGSNTTLTISFTDYYVVKSVSLSFPDYYQTIPDISIFTGSTLQHKLSINDPFAMLSQFKDKFVTGTDRIIKFEALTDSPATTRELKFVFDHDCKYVAISDFKMEYETFDWDDTFMTLVDVKTFWIPQYYVDGDWLPKLSEMPPSVII